jgi:glycosyltransferase involved in cell wall biosynthesis
MISVVLLSGPGLDDYTLHLANALSNFSHVAYCVDANQYARFGAALDTRVTPLVFRRPRRREMWGFEEMRRLARAIRAFQPNVFHLQGDGVWESVLLRMLGSLPLINTVHDPIKHIDQRNWLNNTLQWDAVRRACGWVVHSPNLKDIFIQRFHVDPDRVLVHPHGISDYYTRFAPPDARHEENILFFGELRHNKGGDILLRAFEALDSQLPGWHVIVAGRGNGLDDEHALIARLDSRLDYRPRFIPDAELAALFSRAGIVALPYRHGSHSGVLTIAAAFSCPVLVTRSGNFPELVQHGKQAFFVEPENETDLRQGLLTLAQDEALRIELGCGLNELAQTAWNWKSIAECSAAFYERVLER